MPPPHPPAYPSGTGYPYGVPPYDPLVAYDFSSWIDRLVGVVRRSWKRLLSLFVLGYLLPMAAVGLVMLGLFFGTTLMGDPFENLGVLASVITFLVLLVVAAIYLYLVTILAAVKLATNDAAGQSIRMVDAYRSSWPLGWPTFGWSLAAGFLIGLGLLACLLPGIYLFIAFSVLVPVMAFQRQGGLAGSFKLVNGNFWPVAGRIAMLYGVTTAVSLTLQAVGDQVSIPMATPPMEAAIALVGVIVSLAVDLLIEVVVLAGLVVTYAELRGRRQPGLTTAHLVAEVNA